MTHLIEMKARCYLIGVGDRQVDQLQQSITWMTSQLMMICRWMVFIFASSAALNARLEPPKTPTLKDAMYAFLRL